MKLSDFCIQFEETVQSKFKTMKKLQIFKVVPSKVRLRSLYSNSMLIDSCFQQRLIFQLNFIRMVH